MERYTIEKPKRVWLSADLHLDHRNIIRYCHRPFRSVQVMNRALINNWNKAIHRSDTVFFLGDLCKGTPWRWLRRLNGKITFIRGSHDRGLGGLAIPYCIIQAGEKTLLLIHSPRYAPRGFDGWIIHGHYHNNDLKHHPFIDHRHRRMNISVELTGYKPISLYEVLQKIK